MHNDYTYDKINNEVAFRESDHKYFNIKHPDRQYTSCTTLISKYHEHFDEEFWSRYKALQELIGEDEFDGPNIDPKTLKRKPASEAKKGLLNTKKYDHKWTELYDISVEKLEEVAAANRAKYLEANRVANERGTAYHLMQENKFYKKSRFNDQELVYLTDKLPIQGEYVCAKGNFDLSREKAVLPEYLVYFTDVEGVLHLAGQMDLLIKDGNDIYILDFKTNAKGMVSESYKYFDVNKRKMTTTKMFHPISNLDDHMLNHYTLQLSIYAFMLQRINPDFNIKMLMLLHVDGEGVETEYEVPYLKKEVELLLKHYKRQVKIDSFREENKRVD